MLAESSTHSFPPTSAHARARRVSLFRQRASDVLVSSASSEVFGEAFWGSERDVFSQDLFDLSLVQFF